MAFQNGLYPDFFNEMLNFDTEPDYNETCNVILTKNQTLIEIDRGWEGIPETFIINIVLCLVWLDLSFRFVVIDYILSIKYSF